MWSMIFFSWVIIWYFMIFRITKIVSKVPGKITWTFMNHQFPKNLPGLSKTTLHVSHSSLLGLCFPFLGHPIHRLIVRSIDLSYNQFWNRLLISWSFRRNLQFFGPLNRVGGRFIQHQLLCVTRRYLGHWYLFLDQLVKPMNYSLCDESFIGLTNRSTYKYQYPQYWSH